MFFSLKYKISKMKVISRKSYQYQKKLINILFYLSLVLARRSRVYFCWELGAEQLGAEPWKIFNERRG